MLRFNFTFTPPWPILLLFILLAEMSNDIYTTPLTGRYSSPELQKLFSLRTRFSIWRHLWLWLAESQKELGLDISDQAIDQMKASLTVQDDEFKIIAEEEKRRRSVRTWGLDVVSVRACIDHEVTDMM